MTRLKHFATMLAAVMIASSLTTAWANSSYQPECRPGTYLEGDNCTECPEGKFTRNHTRAKSCIRHKVCEEYEVTVGNGTSTSDTLCRCKEGQRKYIVYEPSIPLLEYTCAPCNQNTTAKPVIGGLNGDTGCCSDDSLPFRDTIGNLICRKASLECTTTSADQSDAAESPVQGWTFDVGSFFIGVTVCFVIVMIISFILLDVKGLRPQMIKIWQRIIQFFKRDGAEQDEDAAVTQLTQLTSHL